MYDKRYQRAFNKAKRYIEKIYACNKVYILINNRNEISDFSHSSDNIYIISGSNTEREFSGWQKGLEFLSSLGINYDIILFLNDSCFVYGQSIIENNNLNYLLSACLKTNSILGQIDSIDSKLNIYGYEITSWIRTNCFFIPRDMISKIGNIVSITNLELDNFISPKYQGNENLFQKDAPIDNFCRYFIITHLTKVWHSKFRINADSWEKYRKKSCAMLNEFLLTAKWREKGLNIINYEDL